jgi:hypothetical protein
MVRTTHVASLHGDDTRNGIFHGKFRELPPEWHLDPLLICHRYLSEWHNVELELILADLS